MIELENKYFKLNLPNAEIEYIPNFISSIEAEALFNKLRQTTHWREDTITVFGKTYPQPRLTELYSLINKTYSYSNVVMKANPVPDDLKTILNSINKTAEENFNTILLNLYRSGNDSNGWHADNEKELGDSPQIASLSLGEERLFHFKHRKLKNEKYKINLASGSLLLMKGEMQNHWLHQIPKTKKLVTERINLTFRSIL